MVAQHRSSGLHAYVLAVSAVGLGLLVLLIGRGGLATVLQQPAVFWALVICLVVAESIPIFFQRGATQVATTAEAFAFAILLGWGTAAATFALVLGLLVGDALRRAAPEKVLFNAGQYGLLMAATGGLYEILGGDQPFTARQLPAFAAAAVLFYVGNHLLVALVTSLAYGNDFAADLKESLRVEARPYAMVFGLAPIVLVVAEHEVSLLPLVLLPLLAVWVALRSAVEAEEGQAAAELTAEQARLVAAEQLRLAATEHALVERLQESDRLKDDLLAAVSHELTDPQRQELVDMAARQGDRLKFQIEQLLLAARLERSGHEPAERPVVDAAAVAREALAAARSAYPTREFVFQATEVLPVRALPEAVMQVLGNLLDNAAKYSPADTPIRLEVGRSGRLAVVAVEDAGPGVPAAERDRIFERFTQLDSGATRRAGGVGLGLYIARQLANAQGGELLVGEPTGPAWGARFELRLPLAELDFRRPG
jgi:signal transduction histidine kinase